MRNIKISVSNGKFENTVEGVESVFIITDQKFMVTGRVSCKFLFNALASLTAASIGMHEQGGLSRSEAIAAAMEAFLYGVNDEEIDSFGDKTAICKLAAELGVDL